MADMDRIKRNIGKMIDQGATEPEIDSYIRAEGMDPQAMKVAPPAQPAPSTAPTPPPESVPFGDIPRQAMTNLPKSAAQFGRDVVQPIIHPVDTAKALYTVATDPQARDMVGKFFADRYGGWENVKRTMAQDPAGFLSDVSIVLSGGGTAALKGAELAGKATSVVGKAGKLAADVGRAADPLTIASKAAQTVGTAMAPVAKGVAALGTGRGLETFTESAKALKAGGDKADIFRGNMTGRIPQAAVLEEADNALQKLYRERSDAYQAGMKGITADPAVLEFQPINNAIRKVADVGMYEGKVINRSSEGIWKQISDLVDEWRMSDPQKFHTPAGLDALKKAIGDVRDNLQPGTPSFKVANDVYRAVWKQISDQAPGYAKVMKDYQEASDLLTNMKSTLSMGKSIDTELRKFQSVLRDGVQTNYGERANLVKALDDASGGKIMPALAGQSLKEGMPGGLSRMLLGANLLGAPYALGAGGFPWATLALPLQSPRLVGEAMDKSYRLAGMLNKPVVTEMVPRLGNPSFQAGRLANQLKNR